MKQYKALLSIILLVILYAVGLFGIALGMNNMSSSPFSLLVSPFLLFASHGSFDRRFAVYVFTVVLCGFLLSWIGVTTGHLFGQFFYGNNLGHKVWDVPLIMGISWLVMSYCTSIVAIKLFSKLKYTETSFVARNAQFVIPFVAALLGVLLQFFVEQIASVYDFWYWKSQEVPLQNYTAWFAFLYAFNYLFYKLDIDADNKVAIWLYALQVLFFAGLTVVSQDLLTPTL